MGLDLPVERAPTRKDVAANAAGFALFAGGALVANLVIARVYGPATTGLFNQVLALYTIASQLAALGLHIAALRDASLAGSSARGAEIAGAALLGVALSAGAVTLIGYGFSFAVPVLFRTPDLDTAWRLALPGLFLFAVNKVLVNLANGFGRYRLFAAAQAGRPLLFLAFIGLWVAFGWRGESIALAMSLAEAALAVGLTAAFLTQHAFALGARWREDMRNLFRFGVVAMPSVAFADLNARLDVLVLGVFARPEVVGVYTIASWLVQGAVQLPVALRPLVNSSLARLAAKDQHAALRALVRKVGRIAMVLVAGLLGFLCLIYEPFAAIVLVDPRYQDAWVPLAILSVGVSVAAYYLPFDLFQAQAGRPAAHSRFKGTVMLLHLVLAVALVPRLGPTGSAIAYGSSFVLYAVLLRRAIERSTKPGPA